MELTSPTRIDLDNPKEVHRLYPEQEFNRLTPDQQAQLLQQLLDDLTKEDKLDQSTLWLTDPGRVGYAGPRGTYPEPLVQAGAGTSFSVRKLSPILYGGGHDSHSIGYALPNSWVDDRWRAVSPLNDLHRHIPELLEERRPRRVELGVDHRPPKEGTPTPGR